MHVEQDDALDTLQERNLNPYKGLESYRERDKGIFFGRGEESEKLLEYVRLNMLTVLFGKAGIGKTSLLNAGLFPLLREKGFLPIRLRLNFTGYPKNGPSLMEQVTRAIRGELKNYSITLKAIGSNNTTQPISREETLWEYFRRVSHIDPTRNKIVVPVLVFDQFEEIFTLGKYHGERERLIAELWWLIEDRQPDHLIDHEESESNIPPNAGDVRVLFSLREDYLPHLTDLKTRLPSIENAMLRLTPLTGTQGREVIRLHGGFWSDRVIEDILRCFYPEEVRDDRRKKIADDQLEIEPAFLSLLCHELFEKREVKTLGRRLQQEILTQFYESKMKNCPDEVQRFIETKLLTESGSRTPFFLEPSHPLHNAIDYLADIRILRKFSDGKKEFIEIIHDVLAPIIEKKRDKRLIEVRKTELKKQLERRYLRISLVILSIVAIILALLSWFALVQKSKADRQFRIATEQYRQAQVNRLRSEALMEFPRDNTKAIRIAEAAYELGLPNPPPLNSQTLASIGYSFFDEPFYTAILRHKSTIYSAIFSPDGENILTASEDGRANLWSKEGKLLVSFDQHKARVMSAVFSPDGQLILTASWDKTAKLWERDGHLLQTFSHGGIVSKAIFSPDGRRILTASRNGTVKMWSPDGTLLLELDKHNGAISSIVFSPDGRYILTASWDKTAKIWDLDGQLITSFKHQKAIFSASFSPDGKRVLTSSWDFTAKCWNLEGRPLSTFTHKGVVSSALFSADGQRVLTGSWDKTVKLWTTDGHLLVTLKHQEPVSCAAFSKDGRQVVTGEEDGTAKTWNLQGKLLKTLKKHPSRIRSAYFSPDGNRVLTASEDGTARVWSMENIILAECSGHKADVQTAFFSPDGQKVLTASRDHTAKIWDLKGNLLADLNQHKGIVYSAVFSPNGQYIVTAGEDNMARLWTSGGKLLVDFHHDGMVSSAVFSPDSRRIVTASVDQTIRIWNLDGSLYDSYFDLGGALSSAVFSPDGKSILAANIARRVLLWKLGKNKPAVFKHDDAVTVACFSADGSKILSASIDGRVKIWTLEGKVIVDLFHDEAVTAALFSPDGSHILTGSEDGSARLWNLQGLLVARMNQGGVISSVTFSPDGSKILTASWDYTAKLWDREGRLLANLDRHQGVVSSAIFSPTGNRILTASRDGTARIWYIPEAIFQWLQTAQLPHLSVDDCRVLNIPLTIAHNER